VVYSRDIGGKVLTFGVSGRLYKSNVLLYDHRTDSLWSQLLEKAIAGPMVDTALEAVPSSRTTWGAWRRRHPDTRVLSTDTGYDRNYQKDPYKGYARVGTIWFPVGNVRTDLSAKKRVMGIEIGGSAKAYPLERITLYPGILTDRLGDETVEIEISPEGEIASVRTESGDPIAPVFLYWFAWQAFHPDTSVYRP
jgi:uncharacterized protein YuzE